MIEYDLNCWNAIWLDIFDECINMWILCILKWWLFDIIDYEICILIDILIDW